MKCTYYSTYVMTRAIYLLHSYYRVYDKLFEGSEWQKELVMLLAKTFPIVTLILSSLTCWILIKSVDGWLVSEKRWPDEEAYREMCWFYEYIYSIVGAHHCRRVYWLTEELLCREKRAFWERDGNFTTPSFQFMNIREEKIWEYEKRKREYSSCHRWQMKTAMTVIH